MASRCSGGNGLFPGQERVQVHLLQLGEGRSGEIVQDDGAVGMGGCKFDQRRNAILIQKQVVDAPVIAAVLSIGNTHFALDQQPPPQVRLVELLSRP